MNRWKKNIDKLNEWMHKYMADDLNNGNDYNNNNDNNNNDDNNNDNNHNNLVLPLGGSLELPS